MLWLICAVLTVAILAVLLFPLLKGGSEAAAPRVDYDIVVYRNQLAEIEQEIERGLLTEGQADAARAEVHRRMLAAEDAELKTPVKPGRTDNRRARFAAIAIIAFVLPVGAAVMYGALGSPQLPGKPYAWRLNNDPEFIVAATAEKLAALLKNSPSASGYKRLAEMYFDSRNYEQAAAADRRAIALGGADAVTWSELGEAIVMTNGGVVVPEAMLAFANSIGMEPHGERARFYIGLAEAQIGNLKQAVGVWRDLERTSDPNAPWLPMLRDHIAAFSKEGGFDPASVPPSPLSAAALNTIITAMTNAMHLQGGTSAAANTNAMTAPPSSSALPSAGDDQDTKIHAMVQRLADRMEKSPGDASGWQRLAHAYNVLGERDKARAAIDRAVRLKPSDVDVQLTLAEIQKAAAVPGDDAPADFVATMRTVLKLDAGNVQALYYVGLAEQKAGHTGQARLLWNKALKLAAADDPLAISIRNRLDAEKAKPD
ncbi:MAG: c-type cytochrome biogenesis protein CcmI [Alphaproteobacteria bacterium]|nr:c-type cytochrome biogenesis protein CcmI [Alphaproteobacteria bacterium]